MTAEAKTQALMGAQTLPGRGVLALTGEDARPFLQGLVTNDVRRVAPDRAVYAVFLTPQGKFLHEMFIIDATLDGAPALLLDTELARRDDLLRRLKMYKLRAKVALADVSDRYGVAVNLDWGLGDQHPGDAPGAAHPLPDGGIIYTDPRHAGLGARLLLDRAQAQALPVAGQAYETRRLDLAVPDGSRDLLPEKAIPLENGLDRLNAVSFDKGCYMGQELTARTHYRALIKRRLMTVRAADGATLPPGGTPITLDGREVGEMRSSLGDLGLALLRIEDVEKAAGRPLDAAGTALTAPS